MKGKRIGLLWENFTKKGYLYESGFIEINGERYKIEIHDARKKSQNSANKTIHIYKDIKNEK